MNVYRVEPFAKPPKSKFDYYAQLDCNKRDERLVSYDSQKNRFNGKPYPKPWRRITMYFDNPRWPRSDFFHTGMGHFGCTERARELVGPAMERAGEFLPICIEAEKGNFFIYNVTKCGDYIDPMKSIWQHHADAKENEQLRQQFRTLQGPVFVPRKIGRETIFKLSVGTSIQIYCAERTSDSGGKEFKALVEHHGLTGLRFDFAWSEKRGPSTEYWPPMKGSAFIWKTGDGRRYKRRTRGSLHA